VNLQFNTSSANFVDVYLTSDQANLQSANINGYFIKIGNTSDEVSLYKRSGATVTKLIDGVDGILNTSNNQTKVRVTRDNANQFTLERDITGIGTSYTAEGSFTDATFTTSAYFGILIQQSTTSFHQKHFFDDISISPIITDISPPNLLSVKAIDSTLVELTFDEALDSISAKAPFNYVLNNGYENPSSVKTTADASKYILALSKGLSTGTYTLTVANVKDKAGNTIASNNTASFSYIKPFKAKKFDLVINEIFADTSPQIDLPSVEFIELYNTTNQTIKLKNWKYSDQTSIANLPADSITGGQHLILCAKADTNEFKAFGKTIGISPWPSLNNSSDIIKLISAENVLIDSIAYLDIWHSSTTKKTGGWSLERVSPLSVCNGLFNWASSTDLAGGTPGKRNSTLIENYDQLAFSADSMRKVSDSTLVVYFNKPADISTATNAFSLSPASGSIKSTIFEPNAKQSTLLFSKPFTANTTYQLNIANLKDCSQNTILAKSFNFTTPKLPAVSIDTAKIYFTEIFADPSPEVALPLAEFVEIYNPGKDTINLDGWTFNDATTHSTIKNKSILPGDYIILCPIADTAQYKSFGKTVGLSPWPSLDNASDQITLKSAKNRLVDSLSYLDSWHSSLGKKQGGWTLERIDYASACGWAFNWNSSIDESGGTPGKHNSLLIRNYDKLTFQADSLKQLTDSSLVLHFNKSVDIATASHAFTLDGDSPVLKSLNFDMRARQATLIFNKQFTANTSYQLTFSNLKDCSGRNLKTQFLPFKTPRLPPVRVDTAQIYFTEIFADPSPEVGLSLAEFVEIYNPGTDTVDLDGWVFNDASTRAFIKKKFILPKEYIILCPIADTLQYKPIGKTIGLSPWPSLNNASDQITLKSYKGRLTDSISYNERWYKNDQKKTGGWSLELIDKTSVCVTSQNWMASIDASGGTPGRQNSVHQYYNLLEPLKVLNASLKDSLTISITFNQPPDSTLAANPQNYSINSGGGKPSAVHLSASFTGAELSFSTPLTRGNTYRVSTSNIKNCMAAIAISNSSAEFFYPHKINKGDILISEVLFNPREGGVDFVEIYNNSKNVLDLKELSIATIKAPDSVVSRKTLSEVELLFNPRQYLVLTVNPDNIKKEYYTEIPMPF
jgi:hypothetical protein